MMERGFLAVGVRELAQAAGVPQGSFVNCFKSKEEFALAVLDDYAEWLGEAMQASLCNPALNPRQRLDAYLDVIERNLESGQWRCGCLVGDLSAEMPGISEAMRNRLCTVIKQQIGYFEAALAGLHGPGQEQEGRALASFLVMAWQGALLRTKVERSPAAVRDYRRMFGRLLGVTS